MKPIRSQKSDIARIIMKEHNKDCIKYYPVKDEGAINPTKDLPLNRRIPRNELEEYLSEDYKHLI